MDTNDRNNNEDQSRNTEFTSSNSNREFHNENKQDNRADAMADEDEQTNVRRAQSENDDYSNTSTGANYSASDRKEKLTDENYGMSGQYTRKDIINKFENQDDNASNEDKN